MPQNGSPSVSTRPYEAELSYLLEHVAIGRVAARSFQEGLETLLRLDQEGVLALDVGEGRLCPNPAVRLRREDGLERVWRRYTVVGYYRDNDQGFTDGVTASSPEAAARRARRKARVGGGDLRVLAVCLAVACHSFE